MTAGRRILAGGLLLLAAAVLALAWMSRESFTRQSQDVEEGYRGEALENRTLLLQKWLEAGGRPATRGGGELKGAALPDHGTLILLHLSQPLTVAETESLLAWVRRGGHLLTDGTATPFEDGRSLAPLHAALGVRVVDRHEGRAVKDPAPMTCTFKGDNPPYRVDGDDRWRLVPDREDDWAYRMGSDGKFVFLTRPEGEGRLTLTPDLRFVYGQHLTQDDNAAYLARLLNFRPDGNPVVVWSRPVDLSLFPWLWAHARALVLSLAALLGAWVWRGWGRFGPPLADPPSRRRSLREHLIASARFMWHGGSGAHLVRRAREALEARAARLNPAYPALAPGPRADWLALASGGNPDALFTALDDRPGRSPQALAQDLLVLERARQRLKPPPSSPSQDAP
ncbi:DUF4350 domain-containing protein [Mesoterricola silvestris]|uniref:DUF4350 domain-containing protein n=1 Tax=Mesoterricola silvestris TaxID=2927979 RepID=A0AA48GPQ2_9BACT|nr:DUF4350 domain-containing protein [Mesoterricola silvestris]BDU73435.1 hypothetical protein METEAL_26090 [Mesoterricola silvestris]